MKISEMRLLSDEELKSKLMDSRQELMNLRFQVITGQQTDTSLLKKTRRIIATFETILQERRTGILQEGKK
ncbi:MAG: 50S ribosomal protein L29 [Anaerolineaceae bacterium]|nr:50S ribosomal protein L29 [Anaerolineaceae bacterium]